MTSKVPTIVPHIEQLPSKGEKVPTIFPDIVQHRPYGSSEVTKVPTIVPSRQQQQPPVASYAVATVVMNPQQNVDKASLFKKL